MLIFLFLVASRFVVWLSRNIGLAAKEKNGKAPEKFKTMTCLLFVLFLAKFWQESENFTRLSYSKVLHTQIATTVIRKLHHPHCVTSQF